MVGQHYTLVSLNLIINYFKINKINLFIASLKGDEGIVKLLLEANADLNIQEKDGSLINDLPTKEEWCNRERIVMKARGVM